MIEMELREIFEKLADVEPEWFQFYTEHDGEIWSVECKRPNVFQGTLDAEHPKVVDSFYNAVHFDVILGAVVDAAVARGWHPTLELQSDSKKWYFGIDAFTGFHHIDKGFYHKSPAIAAALALLQAHGVRV